MTRRAVPPRLASIVITSYNYARYLPQTIDSALAQTWPAVEVIVVDDGSTDDSRAIIEAYGSRIHAILKSNGGQGSAVNAGFALTRGEIVLFVDSDDVLLPHAVERSILAMTDPAVAKAQWCATEIDEAGRPTGSRVPDFNLPSGDLRHRVLARGPYGYHWSPTSANAWSRTLLEHILPMPTASYRTCPDLYLAALAPLYGRVERIEEPLSSWRKHVANHSWREDFAARIDEGIERDECTMNALEEHARRLGLVPDRTAWQSHSWWGQINAAVTDIVSRVPPGSSFILANQETWANGTRIAGRPRVPFLERDGVYWGPPMDDAEAVAELQRQFARGHRYFAVTFPHLWYLEHYRGLRTWLRTHAREHIHNDRVALFELHGGP